MQTKREVKRRCKCLLEKKLSIEKGYAIECPRHSAAPELYQALQQYRYAESLSDDRQQGMAFEIARNLADEAFCLAEGNS